MSSSFKIPKRKQPEVAAPRLSQSSERLPPRVGGANVRRSPRLGPVSLRPACPSLLLYDSLTDYCLPLTAPGPPPSLGVRC
uniref:Uncharacterized protein n=1 Tax=Oryzias sinensis TaxID=183150 RepID=A0A8C8DS10_9TELE